VEKCGKTRQATEENIILRMCIACWIPKALETHSEYIYVYIYIYIYIYIYRFAPQQFLRECATILR